MSTSTATIATPAAPYPLDLETLTAAQAWSLAFGDAFLGEDRRHAVNHGRCDACGMVRDDLLLPPHKNRPICAACAPMSAKKPKREGGNAGPSENQSILITAHGATYAGPLAAPTGLPAASTMTAQHGRRFLADVLYDPPPPPFYLLTLAKNSDPILGQTRLTRHLSRLHLGGHVPAVLDQPLLRRLVDALLAHPAPKDAFKALGTIQRRLAMGPSSDPQAWFKAQETLTAIHQSSAALAELFPATEPWRCRPLDGLWEWTGFVLAQLLVKDATTP